jgi:arginine/lysine/ornithine decarboxylase
MACIEPELVMNPRKAFLGRTEQVPLDQAAGEIAAEMISPYPPGIPAIVPGERITQAIVDFLHAVQELQFAIPDATDPSLEKIRVVA